MIPILETERLTLRGHTPDDLSECTALWADPEVVRYIGNATSTREQAWARVLRYVGHWSLFGFGFWCAVERATGRFVGELGLANFERDITPPIGALETGWVLASWAHGRGFATEGMRAVLGFADTQLPGEATDCVIDPPNLASIRVAHKLGYIERRRATYHDEPIIIFGRG
jgi:RimJ/RimL family protein N-acetyltransferase